MFPVRPVAGWQKGTERFINDRLAVRRQTFDAFSLFSRSQMWGMASWQGLNYVFSLTFGLSVKKLAKP
jgi:hypothetical protein